MTQENSIKIVELYPEMFTFTIRGYEHNIFEKGYNKALKYIHKHIKWTRKINYIKQTNPYDYQFDIGNGWFKIVYELVHGIRINDLKKGDWITKVTQCKEKFGGLRFYVTGTSDKNWALIRNAEQKSYAVCEETGSEVEVGTWKLGWIQTLCRQYALKRYYEKMDKGEIEGKRFEDCWTPSEKAVTIETPKKKKKVMSLAQRELGEVFRKDINKEMSTKHIEIVRFDNSKISIKEYVGERVLSPVTYQPAIIKMIGARLLVINPDNQEEYYDCRYEDCTIKRMNG